MANWLEGLGKGLKSVFGSRNERLLKDLADRVDAVNDLEPRMEALSDAELRAKTDEFKKRLADGQTRDAILPEAFAAVRESSKRTLGMRHFDVQIVGGIVLHEGKIAEMVTGEGKTLVSTTATYLNALEGKGVHIVTVNDYLARRDRDWMAPIFELLGMTVGAIQSQMDNADRKVQYACDLTYGTNSEFGFDYLRDNMKAHLQDQVQRGLFYAVVDEVDSILIDEARTPLIISGPAEESTDKYYVADKIARRLEKGSDFEVKEKEHTVVLTEEGIEKAEKLAGVDSFYTGRNMEWPHHIEQALRAHHLYKKDVEYVVKKDEDGRDGILIVDEFTGRLMVGRRWSDGLHQAVEAKEGLRIREENQTLATITYQNYFKLYKKLAGMTGTAMTEAAEFDRVYKLDVVAIPTNMPLRRLSENDTVFRTGREKWNAIVEEILRVHQTGRPMLVGTVSIENSEKLSDMLRRRGIEHEVLNAKNHEREAIIVAKAGGKSRVTVATNMAGRGTDILLGEGVPDLGGLHIIGTERHESRRIDNQLRGRAGRQGDPGSSRFFLSLEDDLMRIFASERVSSILKTLGLEEGQDIQSPMVNRAIERAQKKVEERNFEIRKNLLEYDEVMNEQRKIVYDKRQAILEGRDMREMVMEFVEAKIDEVLTPTGDAAAPDAIADLDTINLSLDRKFGFRLEAGDVTGQDRESLRGRLLDRINKLYDEREVAMGADNMRRIERFLLLNAFDTKWKDHLHAMDQLKSGVGLRAYGQIDPKLEYKKEGYDMFDQMIGSVQDEVTDFIFKIQVEQREERERRVMEDVHWDFTSHVHHAMGALDTNTRASMDAASAPKPAPNDKSAPIRNKKQEAGRNDPCPCGSGKKFKKCHGAASA
ncbi:MAG: preprotein translocase subunit SecA [Planctomycetes bacterium]|nr:preprotein translocase subunit SecA [Planctomycetota bacterium]MBI3844587.1 preprotein translocase subunit SecA [Planctomycetota bacterium]